VFEMVNSSGSYSETVLHSFLGQTAVPTDGALPYAGLLMDAKGNLYGTTSLGGTSNTGTVFELVNSSGSYSEIVLYSFLLNGDGKGPLGGVVLDSNGNIYGTTQFGGTSAACGTKLGCGTVFELLNSSGSYTETLLHTFAGLSGSDGGTPLGLIMDPSGNLFGVTEVGGASNTSNTCVYGCGTVFELLPSPQGYTETILYSFPTFAADGLVPDAALVMDSSNNLYGITSSGGFTTGPSSGGGQTACPSGCGTVFEVVPATTGPADTISETSGSGQSATVGTQFASPLIATVLDSNKNPVSNIAVTFTAPLSASGASGTFADGTNTAMVTTDASGHAAAAFTANNTSGSYQVTATAPNVMGTATFSLMNEAAQVPTTTTITGTSSTYNSNALPANTALVGTAAVLVNFTVTSASGTPTGTVTVTDGLSTATDSCTATLNLGAGSCSVTISQVPASGIATLTAKYTPASTAFVSSTSNSFMESVAEIVSCGPAPGAPAITAGQTANISFNVCSASNVNAVPTATLSGCPQNATCTITITPIVAGGYTVTVTIATVAGGVSLPDPQPRGGPWPLTLVGLSALLAMLMALHLARKDRVRPQLVYAGGLLLALALLLNGVSGCSGSGSTQNGTALGNFALNVKVAAGNFNVVVPVNGMVQK
jgi:uncharacterized repeat protein (TIGR03803 family)